MDKPTEHSSVFHIPSSRFNSDNIPATDRFDAWSDSVSLLFRPVLAGDTSPEDFSVSTEAFLLGETIMAAATVAGVGGYRNRATTPLRDGAEIFIIHYYRKGGFTGYNGAQILQVNPGDIVILDPTRGLSTATVASDVLTYVVPRDALLKVLGRRIDLYPRVISGKTLVGQILGETMLSTWMRLPQLPMTDAAAVSGLLLGAIAGMLRGGDNQAGDPAMDHATLNTICAYIERNLTNPELGPDYLCKRFHCSRARLYRLFAPLDGVANYIRRTRLERCHIALLTTAQKINVSDVAMEWGFGSISHFNRLFRETYGVSPGEVKGAGNDPSSSSSTRRNTSRIWVPEYRQWIEHL